MFGVYNLLDYALWRFFAVGDPCLLRNIIVFWMILS